ncbi:TetR/AcrR family transcriptional regulator [Paenibacillus pasadenensis]|uniref:Transcriptional regulator, TetR family n=1 Tax=Paenibacillus pasadenensis TaxID=217090 RepID=A0A2N5N8F6_9BACL|nr:MULTISPECIES: TetR/AcrR family transcriptional regulator [Paenibacillus]PLT46622.1 Transcriptional regulator, TetR family [Paenibacillus pasadenensis]QGG57010.1 TetR family transcriptional regulator [Paenibacillus sp. B01]
MRPHSLRDLKKEATAHALAKAAFELALEKGLDGFVVEDVVQRAGYSRRTFANYFSCKEEAVAMIAMTFDGNVDEDQELHIDLAERLSPLDVLHRWLQARFTADLLGKVRELFTLSRRHPTLEPFILSVLKRLQAGAEEELRRYSADGRDIVYTHLLAGAVFGAVLPILDGTLKVRLPGDPEDRAPDAIPFEQHLETTFGYLKSGF